MTEREALLAMLEERSHEPYPGTLRVADIAEVKQRR
jgi:hypothetical protein